MGGTSSIPITNPHEIVLERAKVYLYKKKYIQVYVFTSWVSELRALTHAFGGKTYRHGSGYKWMLAKRDDLVKMVEALEDELPSKHHFEDPIIEFYKQKDPS